MEVVALKTMLGSERYDEIKNGDYFLGEKRCLTINGELYFLVRDAEYFGYLILPNWIETI
jgi:hypothetical protein